MPRVHVEPMRVRYGDTDQMGVVYYANYLRFFEVARAEWLRAGGLPYKDVEADGALFPVVEARVRYLQPARYDDLLEVACEPARVGAATVRFTYRVYRDAEVLAEGHTDHACIGTNGRVRRFPPRVAELLAAIA